MSKKSCATIIKESVKNKSIRLTRNETVRWIAKLRSGNYEQTTNSLSDGYGYCCLGVLETIKPSKFNPNGNGEFLEYAAIPERVQDILSRLNDGNGWKFPAIADFIEKNILPHFPKK